MTRQIRGGVRPKTFVRRLRYFGEAIVLRIALALLRPLPLSWGSGLGGFLGRAMGRLLTRDDLARRNLIQAFPEKDRNQIENLVTEMWDNLGRSLAEFARLGTLARDAFERTVTVEGGDELKAYLGSGRPCIFFSAHLANWEIAPKTLAMLGHPLALVFRRGNNPALDRLVQRSRAHYQSQAIPKGDTGARLLLRAIRQRVPIGMLVDQKMNDGIPVEFFGRPAMTAPAIAQLALKYDGLLIPVRVVRTGGVRHRVMILAPLAIPRTGDHEHDVAAIMRAINRLLEDWIRECPGQWLWIHRRWPSESRVKDSRM